MVWPLIETLLSALNEPWIVNCSPSETDLVCPFMVTEADAGKVLVRAPYALLPWLLELTPWPAVYKNVSDGGRFLLLLSQMVHFCTGGGGGGKTGAGGGSGGAGQLDPMLSIFVIVASPPAMTTGQQP
jgi:hypothetical protein